MKAMILAAGRGERMRPLTDHTPKPLLPVLNRPLIEYHIERLTKAGYHDIVINTHHLGEKIRAHLGNGEKFGVKIHYSDEQPEALETGGGIFQALPYLGSDTFLVINGDIWCDHSLSPPNMDATDLAHLVLVNNPVHNLSGDFALQNNKISNNGDHCFTFSGIGWYRAVFFSDCSAGRFSLAPMLIQAANEGLVSGELYNGQWMDIGTPQRLKELESLLRNVHEITSTSYTSIPSGTAT
jgi:MurNAc alpha-1-phosphate uridylyltransferase